MPDAAHTASNPPQLGIWQAVAVLVSVKGAQFALLAAVAQADQLLDTDLAGRLETVAVVLLVIYLAAVRWAARHFDTPVAELCPVRPVPSAYIVPMFLTVLGLSVLASELAGQIDRQFPTPLTYIPNFFGEFRANFAVFTLVVIVAAPLSEEPLFRGVFLRGFRGSYGPWHAVLLSAALFALVHEDLRHVPVPFVLGLVWGWWTLRTGSLVPALAAHALHNGLPALLGFLEVGAPGYNMKPREGTWLTQPLWIDLAALALCLYGVWRLHHLFRAAGNPQ